eukprot:gene5401-5939_t
MGGVQSNLDCCLQSSNESEDQVQPQTQDLQEVPPFSSLPPSSQPHLQQPSVNDSKEDHLQDCHCQHVKSVQQQHISQEGCHDDERITSTQQLPSSQPQRFIALDNESHVTVLRQDSSLANQLSGTTTFPEQHGVVHFEDELIHPVEDSVDIVKDSHVSAALSDSEGVQQLVESNQAVQSSCESSIDEKRNVEGSSTSSIVLDTLDTLGKEEVQQRIVEDVDKTSEPEETPIPHQLTTIDGEVNMIESCHVTEKHQEHVIDQTAIVESLNVKASNSPVMKSIVDDVVDHVVSMSSLEQSFADKSEFSYLSKLVEVDDMIPPHRLDSISTATEYGTVFNEESSDGVVVDQLSNCDETDEQVNDNGNELDEEIEAVLEDSSSCLVDTVEYETQHEPPSQLHALPSLAAVEQVVVEQEALENKKDEEIIAEKKESAECVKTALLDSISDPPSLSPLKRTNLFPVGELKTSSSYSSILLASVKGAVASPTFKPATVDLSPNGVPQDASDRSQEKRVAVTETLVTPSAAQTKTSPAKNSTPPMSKKNGTVDLSVSEEVYRRVDHYLRTRRKFDSSRPLDYRCAVSTVYKDISYSIAGGVEGLKEILRFDPRFVLEADGNSVTLACLTPYRGSEKVFGKFRCTNCGREWTSRSSECDVAQSCKHCSTVTYPFKQKPLNLFSPTSPSPSPSPSTSSSFSFSRPRRL